MEIEGEQRPNLVELYDSYNREDILAAYGLGAATVIAMGISGLMLATTPSRGFYEIDEGVIRANSEVFLKWATNVLMTAGVFGAEIGAGFVGWKRSEARRNIEGNI